MIPKLYRGDGDPKGIRKLRELLPQGQFITNYINGGLHKDVYEKPLLDVIGRHVDPAIWPLTPFLSFSETPLTAFRFGTGNMNLQPEESDEFFEVDEPFEFALLTLDPSACSWRVLETGVYEGFYAPSLRKFKIFAGTYRVLLFDVVSIFQRLNGLPEVYQVGFRNALSYKEWLVLPATPIPLDHGVWDNSCILDGACLQVRKMGKV